MTNAALFRQMFGIYSSELWVMSEKEFTDWLCADTYLDAHFQKWIPCSKGYKPEPDERCLVTLEGFAETVIAIMEFNEDCWVDDNGMRYPLDMVTAWMPLPDEYKEEHE